MRPRFICLDLDGVLSPHPEPVPESRIKLLKLLSSKLGLILASGKPVEYLEGFSRGIGLDFEGFVGENGGHVLVPKLGLEFDFLELNPEPRRELEAIAQGLRKLSRQLGFRLRIGRCSVTIYQDKPHRELLRMIRGLNQLKSIKYPFGLQILPKELDKLWGIRKLSSALGFQLDELIAIGHDEADLMMVESSGLGISIAGILELESKAKLSFPDLDQALSYLLEQGIP